MVEVAAEAEVVEEEYKGIQRNTKEVQTATALLGPTRLPVELHTTLHYESERKYSKGEGSSPLSPE